MTPAALAFNPAPGTSQVIALPEPRSGPISIRAAVAGGSDIKFIDDLQRKHAKMVGWFPTKQLETNIERGQILFAEENGNRVGYVIAHDKYLKREELGVVYQLNVAPGKQRGLIGASLIKAVFERAAYGCKLFCCWCAQDLEANHFWESLGFVPLAFRTGSRKAGAKKEPRIHIFWQRRIREGDVETPYWFPSETTGGALRENRLVLPIPPGTHWSDAKPAILPGMENVNTIQLDGKREKRPRAKGSKKIVEVKKPSAISMGGLRFGALVEPKADKKKDKPRPARHKNNPQHVAAARELRDRYLEQVNAPGGLLLPPSASGKYDVSRQFEAGGPPSTIQQVLPPQLLKAA